MQWWCLALLATWKFCRNKWNCLQRDQSGNELSLLLIVHHLIKTPPTIIKCLERFKETTDCIESTSGIYITAKVVSLLALRDRISRDRSEPFIRSQSFYIKASPQWQWLWTLRTAWYRSNEQMGSIVAGINRTWGIWYQGSTAGFFILNRKS